MRNLLLLIFICTALEIQAQETITVDFSKTLKSGINRGIGGANLCWLLDSDKYNPNKKQSMYAALNDMGCGSLRFPYGHLADNYLWHTPPYGNMEGGLRPKVASGNTIPGKWDWAVNRDGSFKNSMDFDEYMVLCEELQAKPLVVVNVFSFKYKGGPAFEELVEAAAAWVRYAKTKKYKVAYWQIGNEVDHHEERFSKQEYVDCYQKMVKAMKAEDPSIATGPGILSKVSYFNTIMAETPELIDFVSCHQYMFPFQENCKNYDMWKEHSNQYIPNVLKMQRNVTNSSKSSMEILITETGVSPSNDKIGRINNTYKALWWFEVLMQEISQKNVAYAYFWGSHSPWNGNKDKENDDSSVLFRIDDNSRKPIGEVVKFVNENIPENLVSTSKISGYTRSFAGLSDDGKKATVFLMNKNNQKEKVRLQLNHLPKGVKTFERMKLKGKKAESRTMTFSKEKKVSISGDAIWITLEPLSITVLKN